MARALLTFLSLKAGKPLQAKRHCSDGAKKPHHTKPLFLLRPEGFPSKLKTEIIL